jgi:hypothetical protein
VLTDLEVNFLKQLSGLDVPVNKPYQDVINGQLSTPELTPILNSIGDGTNETLAASAASAYRSMIGFYNGKLSKLGHPGAEPLISFANTFVYQTGLKELPEIEMLTIKKMQLPDYVGLNVVYKSSSRLGGGRGEFGRGKGGKSFETRIGRGGSGGRGGRGGGRDGVAARSMSTDARSISIPMKRTIESERTNQNAQRLDSSSTKRTKNVAGANGMAGTSAEESHRRKSRGRNSNM